MKKFFIESLITVFCLSVLQFLTGCTANYKDMSDAEFWNESYGRIRGKTDSTYFYKVEMFDTKSECTGINTLDEPVVTCNFTKILKINPDATADTNYYFTVRIKQKKSGFERYTVPVTDQLDIVVNDKHVVELYIAGSEKHYVSPQFVEAYGYANGYYFVDVMCPIEYSAFVYLANAVTIEGRFPVSTTVLGSDNKTLEGKIRFISYERSGDAQIINRFFNTNPTR